MSIQTFSLSAIQKVRDYIQVALTLPDAEQQARYAQGVEEIPEPESIDDLSDLFKYGGVSSGVVAKSDRPQHWFISTVNPGATLIKLPGLRLKPSLRLVSYLYRAENSGVGMVWAVPEEMGTTAQLEKALQGCDTLAKFPRPSGALEQVMHAFEGDRSPASFLVASILRRELQEFGALGDRRNWSHHRLVEQVPAKADWQWRVTPPPNLAPKVRLFPDGRAAVEFFSCRVTRPATLYRHLDQYPADQYQAVSLDKAIAVAQ